MPPALIRRDDLTRLAQQKYAQYRMQELGLEHEHTRSAEDEELYQACRWDLALFGKTFLSHWCSDEYNDVHLDYYDRFRQRQGSRGHYDVTAAPREHSKTTGQYMVSIVHACVYELERYTIYITYRDKDAENKVRDCRNQLEKNPLLLRVFGPQVGIPWNNADFTTCHGMRVRAASRNTQLRGTSDDAQRPTRVIVDDAEHALRVMTEEQREKTWDWLNNEILYLGEPRTNYEVAGTILHEQGMLKTLLKTPGWHARFYQAVQRFADPETIPLWQTWRDLYIDLSNEHRLEDARAFFETRKAVMLKGSKVLWPTRRPYIALMEARLRNGESSFWQELQNQPLGDSRYIFDMDSAGYCSVTPSGIIRAGGTFVPFTDIVEMSAAWDPVPPKDDVQGTDFASCAVVAQDRAGYLYLLDAYIKQEASMDVQMDNVIDLLWKWDIKTLGIESNGFASLIPSTLREKIKQRALAEHVPEFDVMLVGIVNVRSKLLRIKSMETLVNNHWLQFSTTLDPEMISQFKNWLPVENASHDDGPDSVEMAIRTVRHQFEKRDVT